MNVAELRERVAAAMELAGANTLPTKTACNIMADTLEFLDMQIEIDRRRLVTDEAASTAQVTRAAKSLSYSEIGAMTALFAALNSNEGILVASKVADEIGVTRSVIVNALSKLESAGMVKSRSLGIKGTWIKILRPEIVDVLKAAA